MPEEKKQLSLKTRSAEFVPSTFNETDYTIDVVAATDTPVLQAGWDGLYNEILSMQAGQVRLDRLNNGANVLDNHNRYGSVLTSVLGVVNKAWVDGNKLRCTIQLSKRPELASFISDVKEGIQRNISINYRVYQVEITTGGEKLDEYRCTDWEPFEVSFVSVPADYLSTVRSATDQNNSFNEVTIISKSKTRNMPDQNEGATPTPTPAAPPAGANPNPVPLVNVENERKAATKQQRELTTGIFDACRAAKLDINFAEKLVADENIDNIDKARHAIILELGKSQAPAPRSASMAAVTDDEQVKERNAIEYALLNRCAAEQYPLNKTGDTASIMAVGFRGISVVDAARHLLNHNGQKVSTYNKQEMWERSMSTSDFPNLMSNLANKFLLKEYTATPQTFKAIATKQNLPDFKMANGVNFGGDIKFEEVKEGAEYKYGNLIETADGWKLATYGKILRFTRQLFINDDLGAFTRVAKIIARGATNMESTMFWNMIINNVKTYDNVTLFNATHNNLAGAGGLISATTMNDARTSMQRQKGLTASEYIQVMPKFITIAPEQEFTVDQLLTNIIANQSLQVNPFANSGLQKIIEPRLPAGAWYVFADPNTIESFTYGYLEGNEGLYTETRWGFNVDGVEMKCREDFGVHTWDWRGAYKNPGA